MIGSIYRPVTIALFLITTVTWQATADDSAWSVVVSQTEIPEQELARRHRDYVEARIAPFVIGESFDEWQRTASRLRQQILDQVIWRGVPASWRERPASVEWESTIERQGYRIRKLRYEALPRLWIPALLYEPTTLTGRVPAVLNVNGHVVEGKSVEYKQRRCIELARRGALALNIEWLGMGQLKTHGMSHNHLAKLDLCGTSGLSVFYLAMERGLDLLCDHPHADQDRIAMTGLSGGGWQTIMLSGLDTRIDLAVPVAGHSSLRQRLAHVNSIGDLEQIPTDFGSTADYVHLNALLAPRPALMIYNARDDCCFVANTVRTNTFDPVQPLYDLSGHGDNLAFYINDVPGTHNYELDNRNQFYRFLAHHFGLATSGAKESVAESEVLDDKALDVPLPANGVDFNRLAHELATDLPKRVQALDRTEQRAALRDLLRFAPVAAVSEHLMGPLPCNGFSVRAMHFRTADGWRIPAIIAEGSRPSLQTVLIGDIGFGDLQDEVAVLVGDGARVVAFDPLFFGGAQPPGTLYQNVMLVNSIGVRPLGMAAAQVLAVADFMACAFGDGAVELHAHGPRTSLVAMCAAAVDDEEMIGRVVTYDAWESLHQLIDPTARYRDAPEAYCFGLLKQFDIPQLWKLASP